MVAVMACVFVGFTLQWRVNSCNMSSSCLLRWNKHTRFEVLRTLLMNGEVLWDMTPFSFVNSYRGFVGIFFLRLQGLRNPPPPPQKNGLRCKFSASHGGVCTLCVLMDFNPLAPELLCLISAHSVYKMWIIQEPNKLALWNKLHFEEKKTENVEHV